MNMFKKEYGKATTEVLIILQNFDLEDIRKIPKKFINFLQDIADKNYEVNFDGDTKIENLDLLEETKELLGFIYITWLCDEEEFQKWKVEVKKRKLEKDNIEKQKYNTDNLFKTKKG